MTVWAERDRRRFVRRDEGSSWARSNFALARLVRRECSAAVVFMKDFWALYRALREDWDEVDA